MSQHDERSIEIYESISKLDFENGDQLELKSGGDGDNGERLLDLLDLHFEAKDGPAQFDEIADNFISFRLNDDGTHPPAVERVAQRFLKWRSKATRTADGFATPSPPTWRWKRPRSGKRSWKRDWYEQDQHGLHQAGDPQLDDRR